MPSEAKAICLVSACLLGLCTRYDGAEKRSERCLQLLARYHCIPICPEQLGGLPTPRSAAIILGGNGHDVLDGHARVIDPHGGDLSPAFIRGAQMVLDIARLQDIRLALLKANSPSCGGAPVHGVTTALLLRAGIEVRSL